MNFRDVHGCLTWAYSLEGRPIIERPSTFDLGMRSPHGWTDLSVWDLRAQATAIRAQVERLDPPLCWLAVALYSRGETRGPAAQRLLEHLNPPADQREGYALMLLQYVGASRGRGGIDGVRRLLGCRKTAALAVRRDLFRRLDGLHARLLAAIGPKLIGAGLVHDPNHEQRQEASMNDVIDRTPGSPRFQLEEGCALLVHGLFQTATVRAQADAEMQRVLFRDAVQNMADLLEQQFRAGAKAGGAATARMPMRQINATGCTFVQPPAEPTRMVVERDESGKITAVVKS